MSEWSGLVYGRTAVKDYRLIALPAWFDDSTVAWASQHLNVVLRDPGGLRRGPRWALFQNESYRVIGVGCLASDLLGRPSDPDQLALTRERSGTGGPGRELYLFAGYAARHDGVAQAAAPSYAALALELFRPLYGLVVARWEERPYQSQPPERTAGAPPPWAVGSGAGARWGRTVALNHDRGQVALWPDTPEWRAELWATGVTAEAPLSLYLGLASQSDALAGPAGNATVAGLAEPREEPRPQAARLRSGPSEALRPVERGARVATGHEQRLLAPDPVKIGGATLGAALGGVIAGSTSSVLPVVVAGVATGAAAGYIAGAVAEAMFTGFWSEHQQGENREDLGTEQVAGSEQPLLGMRPRERSATDEERERKWF